MGRAGVNNHRKCLSCWILANSVVDPNNPDTILVREPVCVVDDGLQVCCFCGGFTTNGIYVRAADDTTKFCEGHP